MPTSPDSPGGARPRVAYLINQYPKVSHTFIRREILALERRGVTVERIALRGWDAEVVDPQDAAEREKTRYVLKDGLLPLARAVLGTLVRTPGPFLRALRTTLAMSRRAMRPLPYHLVYLAHACRIRTWLDGAGVTHLHAHFGTNPAEIALLLKLLGGPGYSFTVHGADEADNARYLHLDRKVGGAKFVAAISSYTRSQLMRHVPPGDWPKIKVVHCGLDPDFFGQDSPALPARHRFLCIGRFSGEKGHLVLLEAFSRVAADHPDCQLVLAGDGELRPEIEERIRALGLEDRVRITGWISSAEVREELIAATVLVQPSFQEGLPVVIMEAMALCRPAISTYVAGIPELVLPGQTGWLVPAGSTGDLTAAMADSLAAPWDALAAMGTRAGKRVRERHHIDREAAKLAALFAEPDPDGPESRG